MCSIFHVNYNRFNSFLGAHNNAKDIEGVVLAAVSCGRCYTVNHIKGVGAQQSTRDKWRTEVIINAVLGKLQFV